MKRPSTRTRIAPPVIREHPTGFSVKVARCRPFRVSSRAAYLELELDSGYAKRFGFYESRRLTETICDRVSQGGKRAAAASADVRRLLAGSMRAQCDRLRRAADPTIVAVHDAFSRVTEASPTIAMCPELYRHPYLVSDIIKFPAAAIVAANFARLQPPYLSALVTGSAECRALTAMAEAHGANVMVHVDPRPAPHARSVSDQAFVHLHAWRSLLSPHGESYRSLNRTLMNLPRGVPGRLVCLLASTVLPRPITDGLELLVFTLYLDARFRDSDAAKEKLFVAARAPQIREALRRVAAHIGDDLRINRQRDLQFFVRFVLDCPDVDAGTIGGLAKKSIRWHQGQLAQERATALQRYGAKTRVAVPRIPVPAEGEVRLLETVEDIVREGERMGHCVPNYIEYALTGRCYLFHIEREGEGATVMVTRDEQMVEAQGPRNHRNAAAQWGEGTLKAWARGLRSVRTQRERHRDR